LLRGSVTEERLTKTDGPGPSDVINVVVVDGPTHCHCGDGLPPNHHLELCKEQKNMKIFEGLSNSKNMVFIVKKTSKRWCGPAGRVMTLQ
jgi:hypothetical protein